MRGGKEYLILPVLALFLASLTYIFFVSSIHNFGPEGTRFANILDFYSEIPEGSILFIGESQIREHIYCSILDNSTGETCFNLGVNGIMPVQLALQKDLIISTKPKTVVLGIAAPTFDETTNQNEDLFMILGSSGIYADGFMEKRLNDKEKELLSHNFYERALYKRKFIMPFYLAILKQIIFPADGPASIVNNFKDPHFFNRNQSLEELSGKLDDSQIASIFELEKGAKRQRDAFSYLINELTSAKIKVVVIQMPLHPLVSQTVPEESMQLFDNYVQELADTYDFHLLNMQDEFTEEYFTDLTHLNEQGAKIFSQKLVEGDDNIIQ